MGESVAPDEKPIWENDDFLWALIENTSVGLLTVDEDDQILFANPAIETILGFTPTDLIGRPHTILIPERFQSVHAARLSQSLESEECHFGWADVKFPALHRDGYEVPVSMRFREHKYNDQRLFTGIVIETTAHQQREQRRCVRNQDLEEFADVLSHDLRNPLLVAQETLTHLHDRDEPPAEVQRLAMALDRLEQILDDTMTVTLHDGPTESPAVIPFSTVMRVAWESVPTKDASLVLPESEWKIRAHEGRLCQLIENLVRNAVDHVGPAVTVRIGILEDAAGFYLEDDGPGVPAVIQRHVETPGGVRYEDDDGIGLQIVARITEEHDWEMQILDADDGGARFEFHEAPVFH